MTSPKSFPFSGIFIFFFGFALVLQLFLYFSEAFAHFLFAAAATPTTQNHYFFRPFSSTFFGFCTGFTAFAHFFRAFAALFFCAISGVCPTHGLWPQTAFLYFPGGLAPFFYSFFLFFARCRQTVPISADSVPLPPSFPEAISHFSVSYADFAVFHLLFQTFFALSFFGTTAS